MSIDYDNPNIIVRTVKERIELPRQTPEERLAQLQRLFGEQRGGAIWEIEQGKFKGCVDDSPGDDDSSEADESPKVDESPK